MPVTIGQHTLTGFEVETVEGTPIALGAGDKIATKDGMSVPSNKTVEWNEDSLEPTLTQSWVMPEQPKATIPADVRYQGFEKMYAVTMGATTAPAIQTNPLAYVNEYKRSSLEESGTFACTKGDGALTADILEVLELSGTRFMSLAFEQGDIGRLVQTFEAVAETLDYASTTNTSTTMPDLTFSDASYPTNLAIFDHLTVWLAHQDSATFGANEQVCIKAGTATIQTGVSDSTDDNLCTTGGTIPIQANKIMTELALTFLRDNTTTKTYYNDIRINEKQKCKMVWESNQGIPGCSISDSSPSTDISGGGDDLLQVTLTDIASGDTENVEVTLVIAGKTDGDKIATEIQTQFRAATATAAKFQKWLDNCICTYNTTVAGKYFLTTDISTLFDVDVIAASVGGDDVADDLKLGLLNGGLDPDNVPYSLRLYMPEVTFIPPGDDFNIGAKNVELEGRALAGYGANTPVGFTTGDDALLQSNLSSEDIRILLVNRNSSNPF